MKTITRKPTAAQQVAGLNKAGFRYFDFGTLRRDGRKTADFYKGDTLTEFMRESLKSQFGEWVTFGTSRPEYAPEIRRAVVIFPREI